MKLQCIVVDREPTLTKSVKLIKYGKGIDSLTEDFLEVKGECYQRVDDCSFDSQMDCAHCNARPFNSKKLCVIFGLSLMNRCGCILKNNEHCSRNPLHSSASPEYVAGWAMGLAEVEADIEEEMTGG